MERHPLNSTLHLTTTQLGYLHAVFQHPSWAEAAAALGVSASALSQGLSQLETNLGVILFERESRRRTPTEAGLVAADYAAGVLARTDELANWVQNRQAGLEGRLRVGMVDVAALDYFPNAVERFRTERPGIDLRLTIGPSVGLLEQLGARDLDVAVCVAPTRPDPAVVFTELRQEPLVVLSPTGAIDSDPSGWGPWVGFPKGSHTRAIIETALHGLGADYEVVAESHQPEVLAQLVRLGVGWAVLPGSTDDHVVAFRTLVSASRVDAIDQPAAEAFIALL
ncbi:MAG: LysR family transcriptional regulator [Acidobacteria bacterium]|nr:LysR family transcriptional regulator [Acidobacteriota bacterium]